jgi:DNA-binding transcriptional LysR family regulator
MAGSFELREIRVFLILAEELHYGRAADRLALTPSRVSQTIRTLESRLGGRLFNRTSRRVTLSPLGEQLLNRLRPAYDDLEQALADVLAASGAITGTLRLGTQFAWGGPRLIDIARAFEARHLGCQVEISEVDTACWVLGPLQRGEIDLMAIRIPITRPDLVVGPILSSEPRVLAVARHHPLADRASVTLEDIAEHKVARFDTMPEELIAEWTPARAPSGRPIERVPQSPRTIAEIATLILLGRIVQPTIPAFAERFGHPEIVLIPITDLPPSRTALLWRRGTGDPRIREFARIAEEILARDLPARPQRAMSPSSGRAMSS